MPGYTLAKTNTVVRDTSIQKDLPTQNYSASTSLVVGVGTTSNAITRALLFFDLGMIPNDVVIDSANLTFFQTDGATSKTVNVHKLTQSFTDSTNWNTQPSFEETPSASFVSVGYGNVDVSVDIKNLVQRWVNGETNYGLMLKADDEITLNTLRHFQSFENAGKNPMLTIIYSIPTTGKKQIEVISNNFSPAYVASDTSISVPMQAGAISGDLLVINLLVGNQSANVTFPPGWNVVLTTNLSTTVKAVLATKTHSGSESNPVVNVSAATYMLAKMSAFRNVKGIVSADGQGALSATSFVPITATKTVAVEKTVFALFNTTIGNTSFTPPLSYAEGYDNTNTRTAQMSFRYMHSDKDQTTSEVTTTPASTNSGTSQLLVLEPNSDPIVTLTSPANNQTIKQGTDINFQWSGSDPDGDALTYTLQVGTSAGASNTYNASVGSATSKKGISSAWAVGMYYWRVIADDGKGGVISSDEGVFGLAKGNLVAISPANSVVKDTRINSVNTTTNYATENTLAVQGGSTIDRTLQLFDLGLIPNGAIINSAVLKLNKESGPASTVNLHKITSSWVDTSATWANAPSYDTAQPTPLAFTTANGLHQFDVKTLVQDWVNGAKNYGMLFKLPNEATSVNIQFSSANHPTVANRPVLEVDYSIPTTGKKQVEYVGAGTLGITNGSSRTVSLPTGVQEGDLLLVCLNINNTTSVVTAPSGWVLSHSTTGNGITYRVYKKNAQSGEVNPVFTYSPVGESASIAYAFRNVKGVHATSQNAITSNQSTSYPLSISSTVDNTLAIVMTSVFAGATFTSPLSYASKFSTTSTDSKSFHLMQRYLHNLRSQSQAEMTVALSTSTTSYSTALLLEPKTNSMPTVSLTSPANNQTLAEGNTLPVKGTANDQDVGDSVTVRYKINNGAAKNLDSRVPNGNPFSFSKNLTFSNKRLYDGAIDIVGVDLAENVDHTLTVWSEDDKQGKSVEETRKFKVVWNRPPVISGANENLGTILVPPSKTYSVTEPETDTFTITEKVNGTVIDSFVGVAGRQETVTIPHDLWIRLDLGVAHSLIVEAIDSKGLKSTRTYTFTRTETHIEFMLNFDNPAVDALFTLDGMPERVLFTLERYLPPGSEIESVLVTNNFLDEVATWEDATGAVSGGRGYLFTNTTKTAEDWAICVWATVAKGTATQRVHVDGYGGAFD
ncbi:DNRLRE domain-containing protein [Brevibacillus sp. NRS-1366]|uniref:DNRLRE domain-containing protein n=1 Tax=Brevibacillus sp. NRS-1366 TaxID=3233899 RepID=UPI003D1A4EB8